MKELVRIGGIGKRHVDHDAYAAIVEICPEGDKGNYFHHTFETEDPRFARIKAFLEAKGRWLPQEFSVDYLRQYDAEDFRDTSLCQPWATACLSDVGARRSGILELNSDFWDKPPEIGQGGANAIAVSARLKAVLQKSGLTDISFVPTTVVGGKAKQFTDYYWDLTTNITLPRLSPRCPVYDAKGTSYMHGASRRCIVRDTYSPPELHYRASDLRDFPPFDLARTCEPIGGEGGLLIASKRFYEFSKTNALPVDWVPVRIDPD